MHSEGLEAVLYSQDFERGHELFGEADALVSNGIPTIDSEVQRARIRRDDAFTYVREGLANEDIDALDVGELALRGAIKITANVLDPSSVIEFDKRQLRGGSLKKAIREIFSEHGSSINLLGGAATAAAILEGLDMSGDDEAAVKHRRDDQRPYGLSHDFARTGNNGYIRVNGAMRAARQARLNGDMAGVGVWVDRALYGLSWTALHDRRNLRAAARTFMGRAAHLRSYEVAKGSVFTHP
ncbi:MAG TPA: hypothetical protein VHB72_00550 [Candidatus Saccharimonadales bacterium]|nr:hypothetical protein [Candidatus Saccharimonadales bacterium]